MTPKLRVASLLAFLALGACAPSPSDVGASRSELAVCPMGPTVEGVDVADYQGDIDWATFAASSGKEFAIARVSDGMYVDTQFDNYWPGMRAAGVIRGAYQFFRPNLDATAQADLFLSHVPVLLPGDLPPVLDVENSGGVTPAALVAAIHVWVDHVQAALGVQPMIYAGLYSWHDLTGESADFATYKLWMAQYPFSCTYTMGFCPNIPDVWSTWTIWQYCDHGNIPGIPDTTPDLDLFMGSHADLMALAAGSPVDAGTPPDLGAPPDLGMPPRDLGTPAHDLGTDAAVTADAGPTIRAAGGCGCTVQPPRSGSIGWILFGLALLVASRRRAMLPARLFRDLH